MISTIKITPKVILVSSASPFLYIMSIKISKNFLPQITQDPSPITATTDKAIRET